ncbi:hypothetical protein, partial [Komagataeibacter oboediens]|uniref:hypothetical protein n=1 Tax=Komagataeibacter oboediens TaxID=65958 RepID=UPI001C64DA71
IVMGACPHDDHAQSSNWGIFNQHIWGDYNQHSHPYDQLFRKAIAFHPSVSFSIGLYFKMGTFSGARQLYPHRRPSFRLQNHGSCDETASSKELCWLGGEGDDSNRFRQGLRMHGIPPVIPSQGRM